MLVRARGLMAGAAAVIVAGGVLTSSTRQSIGREPVVPLLSTGQTILGQPIAYPTQGPAKVTAAIVSMQPGEETGWHRHDVPMLAYILAGEITVDYGSRGTHVYRAGEAVMEAVDVAHNGRNTGTGEARILAVFMGAAGVPDTVMLPQPAPAPQ